MKQPTKLWAVLPAAGSGKRFSETELKQYQRIGSRTVLEHSVHALYQLPLSGCMIAISEDDTTAKTLAFEQHVQFCLGGTERVHSVLNGLNALADVADDDYILVHDAARPCLHHQQIQQIIEFCQSGQDAAIVAIPVRDTLKQSQDRQKITQTVDRSFLWQAQTPQIAKYKVLKQALEQALHDQITITDEASALEHLGVDVHLIAGRGDNLKITYPEDLELATLILSSQK